MTVSKRGRGTLVRPLRRANTTQMEAFAVKSFHQLWYDSKETWQKNTYLGHSIQQLPLDLWLYQEVIYRTRPAFFIQTGIASGGGLLYFAHLLDAMGADPSTCVIGIDITDERITIQDIHHPRIHMLIGSSVEPETLTQVKALLPAGKQGMVSLDSDHARDHVLREMELYAQFVAPGCCLVVEDTNINGHPVVKEFGPGPKEAVDLFMKSNSEFVRDNLWKRNLISFHHSGWLRRVD